MHIALNNLIWLYLVNGVGGWRWRIWVYGIVF